ncbi:MAG: DUF2948 family protein [Bauldia sp.]
MSSAPALRLVALDEEDLAVISALAQDAVLKVGDLVWRPGEQRFLVAMNRFAWETAADGPSPQRYCRRRSVLHFDRVTAVRSTQIDLAATDQALSLLALAFEPTDAPGGTIRLYFAGGAAIRLTVECVEAQMADLGAEWTTKSVPVHDLSDSGDGKPATS